MGVTWDVSVLGDINPDIILSRVDGEPAPGAERTVGDALVTIGGSSSIFATILARLGLRVRIVGEVGDDWFGWFMLDRLRGAGVDTSGVYVSRLGKTGLTVAITGTHERMLLTFPGAMAELTADQVEVQALFDARHVHVGSFYLQLNLQPAIPWLLRQAVERGLSTSLDPGHDPHESWREIEEALRWTDLLLLNEQEALHIARHLNKGQLEVLDARAAGLFLAERVRREVAVKRGAAGALLVLRDGQTIETPAYRVGVIDTTGAGDAFDAGFVFQWLHGASPQRRLVFASACGAIATTYLGGASGFPELQDVLNFMEQKGGMPDYRDDGVGVDAVRRSDVLPE